MTYQDDPNNRPSHPMTKEDDSYLGWIVGGAVALAVILGIFFMTGRPTNDSVATNNSSPLTSSRPVPSTTGSGTMDAPASIPTPPARTDAPAR